MPYILHPDSNKPIQVTLGSSQMMAAPCVYLTEAEAKAAQQLVCKHETLLGNRSTGKVFCADCGHVPQVQDRYDTLVLKNCAQTTVPREACGAEVVSWGAGHQLAYCDALEAFVINIADGGYDQMSGDELGDLAFTILEQARQQREKGYEPD